jgi:FixJ family two-component response regulator
VDDEADLREVLGRILGKAGWRSIPHESGEAFLAAVQPSHPSCVLLDLVMPGMDGIEVQQELSRRAIDIPIIFLSGGGTIAVATRAMLSGALDFLVKPFSSEVLLNRIERALLEDLRRVERAAERQRVLSLTAREAAVCDLLIQGLGSKQIAAKLSISDRTVEHHRERILKKTQTANTAELASLYARTRGSGSGPG